MAKKISITVKKKGLAEIIHKGSGKKLTQEIVRKSIGPRLVEARRLMLEEFDEHPITRELTQEAPESGTNTSGTLGGYGNLFSFIGFYKGDRPTEEVRRLLAKPITYKVRNFKIAGFNFFGRYLIEAAVPDKEELKAAGGDIPWNPGRSWIDGIEFGISGLGDYFYKQKGYKSSSSSRSKHAFQKVGAGSRPGKYKNTKYITQILKNLKTNIRGGRF